MLTRQENELLTRIGPGTPMGQVMRRYWIPALLAEQLPAPDCAPVRVRLLGEDLVAFRDSQGRVGLLEEYCAHRRASLFLGRNEENGLRCVYHGWKFDVEGRCVDMPNEPMDSRFKEKVSLQSYPTTEMGGVIWAYMGPRERIPDPAGMEWTRAPQTHRFVSQTHEYCNYLQCVEGGIDTCHGSFLHNNDLSDQAAFHRIDKAPRLEVERTSYGFRYVGLRDLGETGTYLRLYQFVLPFHQFRSQQIVRRKGKDGGNREAIPIEKGHMWVPMDDHNTMIYNWMLAVDEDKPLTAEFVDKQEGSAGRGPDGETAVRRRTRENDWLIDREVQRSKTYTGINGVNTQDLAVQESMGPIVDRSREHLGSSDQAIITCRRILLDVLSDFERGVEPIGVDPKAYRSVRAADIVIAKDVRWQEIADQSVARW
jgi:phenylpropionate dioxygenase-like ring-hydroxylating dioxygenase large terminal subunit